MPTKSIPEDAVFEARGVKVVVDSASLPLIDGTVVDFVKQGLNEAFKFQNPKAKGECGCGESFNVYRWPAPPRGRPMRSTVFPSNTGTSVAIADCLSGARSSTLRGLCRPPAGRFHHHPRSSCPSSEPFPSSSRTASAVI